MLNGSMQTAQQNITQIKPGNTYANMMNPFVAPRDGWAFLKTTGTNDIGGYVGLSCSNGFGFTQPYLTKGAVVDLFLPVRKGQTVSFGGLNFTPNTFAFY